MTDTPDRVLYVDMLRASAILLVVVSHVFAPICWAMNDYPRWIWWIFNVADSVIRLCVPVFVMISGKLLLGSHRQEPYLRFVARRFAKVVPPFFSWYMIYRFSNSRLFGTGFSPGRWALDFLQGLTPYHLYFMHIILGLYLVAPFLRRFVQSAARSELTAVVLLWLSYLTLQFLRPDTYGSSGPAATLIGYGGYYLLGYYLGQADVYPRKTWEPALAALAIVVFNALATYHLALQNDGALDEKFYVGLAPLVALYAACFFLALKNLDWERMLPPNRGIRRVLTYVSRDSYNLYLIHTFFIWLFTRGCLGFVLSEMTGGSALVGVPLTTAAVLAASLGLSWLLQRIPIVAKLMVVRAW